MCEYASLDEEALEEMRSAGYYKIRFGIETGSDKVAEKMTLGKKHDLDKLRSMVKFGKSLGMLIYGTISIGGLGSSREEDQKTVDLVYEMASKGWLDEIQVSINTPQPGTDFYNSCVEKSLLSPATNWEGFDGNGQVVVHYPHYPAEEIQSSFKKALSAFDLGKEKSQSGTFSENAKSSFNLIPEGARVLVLRSVRNWMVRLILENLNNNVDLLGQDVSAKDLEGLAGLNQIHSYGSGFFSAESISTDLIEKLRNEQYDFILVPVANNHLQGFQNVLEVAQQIDPENIFYVYPEGHLQPASDSPVAI
ncbi:MAG: radical SAM protein, partial [Nitrospina sp.]|nr:radical SAM protein [Nitrospina sp.]